VIEDVEARKRALRAAIRERRRIRPLTDRVADAAALTQNMVDLVSDLGAGSLSAYLSTPDEPGTRNFLRWTAERGTRVLIPVSRADGLLDWAPYDGEAEDTDVLGMPTPTSELLGPIAINVISIGPSAAWKPARPSML
jgi:5-formyltetrahydrofolate cyclo-ligase